MSLTRVLPFQVSWTQQAVLRAGGFSRQCCSIPVFLLYPFGPLTFTERVSVPPAIRGASVQSVLGVAGTNNQPRGAFGFPRGNQAAQVQEIAENSKRFCSDRIPQQADRPKTCWSIVLRLRPIAMLQQLLHGCCIAFFPAVMSGGQKPRPLQVPVTKYRLLIDAWRIDL